MGRKVIISEPAQSDFGAIVEYISEDNAEAALKLGEDLVEAAEALAQFPFRGKRFGEHRGREIHEIACRGYRIFYQIDEAAGRVEILHLRHGARQEPKF
jgi:plasmid stabilization system protein ParE